MANARRMLECMAEEKLDWGPHGKSSTLEKLALPLQATLHW
jgi:hypothetical protein